MCPRGVHLPNDQREPFFPAISTALDVLSTGSLQGCGVDKTDGELWAIPSLAGGHAASFLLLKNTSKNREGCSWRNEPESVLIYVF